MVRNGELYDHIGKFRYWAWGRRASGVVVGIASAGMGADSKCAVFIDVESGDQLGQVHGQGLESEFAAAVLTVLCYILGDAASIEPGRKAEDPHRLVCESSRYYLMIERQHGKGIAGELEKRGIALAKDAATQAGAWGVSTDRHSRPVYFDRIAEAILGTAEDEEGRQRAPAPVVRIHSSLLVSELRQLVERDGRVEPQRASQHDDLVMAYGIALYSRRRWNRRPALEFPVRQAANRSGGKGSRRSDSIGLR